jgi:hypothetical protein
LTSYADRVTDVGTDSADQAQPEVRVTETVVAELEGMDHEFASAIARAIRDIGVKPGVPIVSHPGARASQYHVMVPGAEGAPVVIYRPSGFRKYLVTGLGDRVAFDVYQRGGLPASIPGTISATLAEAAINIVGSGQSTPGESS